MSLKHKKEYYAGDQIHFIITDDFVDTYNEFVQHCDNNFINISKAVRYSIKEWLEEEKIKEQHLEYIKEKRKVQVRNKYK
ncbi:MAG: hypothetical protein ACOC85_03450 [Thermoplasmatota archaeon]